MADQVRQIKNKKWLETVKQEEIYLRIRDKDPGTKTAELTPTDTPDHTATSDIQDGTQGEDSMPVEEVTAWNWMLSVIGFYRLCNEDGE